jgi:hypothetical protein
MLAKRVCFGFRTQHRELPAGRSRRLSEEPRLPDNACLQKYCIRRLLENTANFHLLGANTGESTGEIAYTTRTRNGPRSRRSRGNRLGFPTAGAKAQAVRVAVDRHELPDHSRKGQPAVEIPRHHSRSPGPFAWDNPASPYPAPGLQPDSSTNELNLRARLRWPSFDVTLFANNALDTQPTLGYNGLTARTFRPRTIGLSATWRFDRSPHSD